MFHVRADRKPQGRKKLSAERAAYFALMSQGKSAAAAARAVGIDRRTGLKWRSENRKPRQRVELTVVQPQSIRLSSCRYLSEDDRLLIADLVRDKRSLRSIALELGCSPSTISREVARNSHPINGQYRPHAAQSRAMKRRPRPKVGKIGQNTELRDFIQDGLSKWRSPEQICGTLREEFPDQPEMHVVHETIYQALYVQGRGELRRELAKCLRTGRARRKPQRRSDERQGRFIDPMLMISERPAEVEDRAVPGHWEGDLIIGKGQKSAIGTLVERATRYVMLVHLPVDHSAERMAEALIETMKTLPEHLRRSLTWDQGCEMAHHQTFTMATNMPVYFCDPASPWQRGSNENTNGLLRQYFPKGTDLSVHSKEDLLEAAMSLNTRPRKTLGWDTPAKRLSKLLEETN